MLIMIKFGKHEEIRICTGAYFSLVQPLFLSDQFYGYFEALIPTAVFLCVSNGCFCRPGAH